MPRWQCYQFPHSCWKVANSKHLHFYYQLWLLSSLRSCPLILLYINEPINIHEVILVSNCWITENFYKCPSKFDRGYQKPWNILRNVILFLYSTVKLLLRDCVAKCRQTKCGSCDIGLVSTQKFIFSLPTRIHSLVS